MTVEAIQTVTSLFSAILNSNNIDAKPVINNNKNYTDLNYDINLNNKNINIYIKKSTNKSDLIINKTNKNHINKDPRKIFSTFLKENKENIYHELIRIIDKLFVLFKNNVYYDYEIENKRFYVLVESLDMNTSVEIEFF